MTSRARTTRLTAGLLAVGTAVALAGCATADPTSSGGDAAEGDAIIVGSFAFPESEILGEI